jgi:cellulose biosynthesis protein BcsQ
MGRVVCFASAKGGSGKTVTAASLATFLAFIGKKVVIIDVDAATNGLTLLYLKELNGSRELGTPRLGMFEAGSGMPTQFKLDERLDVIPATYFLKQTGTAPVDAVKSTLTKTVNALRESYDFIILDAQAGSDAYAEVAIEAADETVLVSEYDPISVEGIERLRHLFSEHLTYSKTWILYNKILPEFSKSVGEFLSINRYLSPIPWDAQVVLRFARRKLAIDMQKGNAYTLAIMNTALSLFQDAIQDQVKEWRDSKEDAIREPIRTQLDRVEAEIATAQKQLVDLDYELRYLQRRSRRVILNIFTLLIAGVSLSFAVASAVDPQLFSITVAALTTPPNLAYVLAIFGSGFFVVIEAYRRFSQSKTDSEMVLSVKRYQITQRLDDLEETRDKFRTLVAADLDTLVKQP